ncbi:MAG: hypothetical protein RHS_5790 [Robinsoniella sp. RHS]|nr:MAG: hypothetical protein RHS_5790 [Robinsoniella sp. RHS]
MTVALPAFLAVTFPFASTEITELLEDLQETFLLAALPGRTSDFNRFVPLPFIVRLL